MHAQKVIAAGLIAGLICFIIAAGLCFGAASKPTSTTLRLQKPSFVAGFTNLLLAGVTGILLYLILAFPVILSSKDDVLESDDPERHIPLTSTPRRTVTAVKTRKPSSSAKSPVITKIVADRLSSQWDGLTFESLVSCLGIENLTTTPKID